MLPKYKVRSVRFYQSVVINGAAQLYCTAPEYITGRRDGKDNSSIEVCEHGVILENKDELTLIGWPNIGAIYYDKSSKPEEVQIEQPTSVKPAKKPTDFRNI